MPFWIGGGASTVCTPLALRSATAAPSVSSVASPQVRCATAGMSNSSCTMAATTAVARLLPLPPAEYVTLTKSGASGASSATTARAAPNVRSPFGGNISNESGQAHAENMSDTVTMTPL